MGQGDEKTLPVSFIPLPVDTTGWLYDEFIRLLFLHGHRESLVLVNEFVYYESIKRKLNKRLILECRCDERLKTRVEGSTRLGYTGSRGEL